MRTAPLHPTEIAPTLLDPRTQAARSHRPLASEVTGAVTLATMCCMVVLLLAQVLAASGPRSRGSQDLIFFLGMVAMGVVVYLVTPQPESEAPAAPDAGALPPLARGAPTQVAIAPGILPGRAWSDRQRHAGAPGYRLHQSLRVRGRAGQTLELQLRLLGPGGGYLPARLSGYAGAAGELLVRHVTEPLTSDRVHLSDHWIFVPEAAFERPTSDRHPRLEAELILLECSTGKPLALTTIPFWLGPERVEAPIAPLLLIPAESMTDASCLVCGELLGAAPVACPHCETASHDECWRYLGGCATYGCRAGHTKGA